MSKFKPTVNNGKVGLPNIKVVGLGGGGCNIVDYMAHKGVEGPELICANTDVQHLEGLKVENKLVLGKEGLGAGSDPLAGAQSAEAVRDKLCDMLEGTDMLFITAGMGGGTGTGAAPVLAQISKEMGILTVAVVTFPFDFEGSTRIEAAKQGIKQLEENVHSVVVIYNNKLMDEEGAGDCDEEELFAKVDDILYRSVMGISNLALFHGKRNVDFKDVSTVMKMSGHALIGMSSAKGAGRAVLAAESAVNNPLTDNLESSQPAKGVLLNLRSTRITINERQEIMDMLEQKGYIDDDTVRKLGDTKSMLEELDESEIEVTILLTGIERKTATLTVEQGFEQSVPTQMAQSKVSLGRGKSEKQGTRMFPSLFDKQAD